MFVKIIKDSMADTMQSIHPLRHKMRQELVGQFVIAEKAGSREGVYIVKYKNTKFHFVKEDFSERNV